MQLTHHFLLAMPGLAGDYFADTLTYICDHSEEGAMGLIVNRPSTVMLAELVAQLGIAPRTSNHQSAHPQTWLTQPVLAGGPVSMGQGFVLHSDDVECADSTALGESLMLSTSRDMLQAIADQSGPRQCLVALGYAGWGPGQLEAEVADNVWLTAPGNRELLFSDDWSAKLQLAARPLGIDFRLIATQAGHG